MPELVDAVGPEAIGIGAASFNAVAARGRAFRQAYATVPETLPSHASLTTSLSPACHGIHDNARHPAARVDSGAQGE
jgi:arylsulfatase A-like enzyme